jgi:hypothetical protein
MQIKSKIKYGMVHRRSSGQLARRVMPQTPNNKKALLNEQGFGFRQAAASYFNLISKDFLRAAAIFWRDDTVRLTVPDSIGVTRDCGNSANFANSVCDNSASPRRRLTSSPSVCKSVGLDIIFLRVVSVDQAVRKSERWGVGRAILVRVIVIEIGSLGLNRIVSLAVYFGDDKFGIGVVNVECGHCSISYDLTVSNFFRLCGGKMELNVKDVEQVLTANLLPFGGNISPVVFQDKTTIGFFADNASTVRVGQFCNLGYVWLVCHFKSPWFGFCVILTTCNISIIIADVKLR